MQEIQRPAPLFINSTVRLRTNFLWMLAGNVVYAACQWGILVVLAKLGTSEMVGQFALGLAVCAPVIIFANLQLRNIQATDAACEYTAGDYLGLRLSTTAVALLIIVAITFVANYRWQTMLVIWGVALAKAVEAISDAFYGLLQRRENFPRMAKSMIIKGIISLAALAVGVSLSGNVFWGVLALAMVWAGVLVGYDLPGAARMLGSSLLEKPSSTFGIPGPDQLAQIRPHWNKTTQKALIKLTLPLGFVASLVSLNLNLPRYFLERHFGEHQLGIYTAVTYLMMIGWTMVSALGQAASPKLAVYYAAGRSREYRGLLLQLISVAIVAGLLGIVTARLAGHQILSLLYKPEYADAANVFFWIMVASGISYISSALTYGMMAARYIFIQVPLFILVSITTVIGCLLLIPSYGMLGAAWAVVISSVVQVVASLSVVLHSIYSNDHLIASDEPINRDKLGLVHKV